MKHPKHLRPGAVKKFDELFKKVESILEDGDEDLLAVLANSYYFYDTASTILDERGPVMPGDKMGHKNPAHDVCRDFSSRISDLVKHFGLSPLSRGKGLGKKDPDGPDDLDKI